LDQARNYLVFQLSPKLAAEIVSYEAFVFTNADVSAVDLKVEEAADTSWPSVADTSTPGDVVELARALFGFGDRVFVCECRWPICPLE
jgi:hypothetical protein